MNIVLAKTLFILDLQILAQATGQATRSKMSELIRLFEFEKIVFIGGER